MPGPLFPFVFVTIACGSISGFHSLIGSGTTPKMIDKERDIRPIGYGAMLTEGLVAVVALIAACSLHPGDYFAINTPPAVYATLDQHTVSLGALEAEVGEKVAGRTGGAPCLRDRHGLQIFSKLPGMRGLMDGYWYHFAIMFEALFILTVIDAGTRVARFLVGEFMGRAYAPFARPNWLPGSMGTTAVVVCSWAYFIWTGSISTIWPMFGVANQLLAAVALSVATTVLINLGRARYIWVTLTPLAFVTVTTLSAGWLNVTTNFWPKAVGADPDLRFVGALDSALTIIMMLCVVVVLGAAVTKWIAVGGTGKDTDLVPNNV